MNLDTDILKLLLAYVIADGGAGLAAYYAIEKWPWASALASEAKRWLAYVISGVLGVLAYLASIAMLYVPAPKDAREWIATLFAVAFTSAGVSQLWHARKKLSNK